MNGEKYSKDISFSHLLWVRHFLSHKGTQWNLPSEIHGQNFVQNLGTNITLHSFHLAHRSQTCKTRMTCEGNWRHVPSRLSRNMSRNSSDAGHVYLCQPITTISWQHFNLNLWITFNFRQLVTLIIRTFLRTGKVAAERGFPLMVLRRNRVVSQIFDWKNEPLILHFSSSQVKVVSPIMLLNLGSLFFRHPHCHQSEPYRRQTHGDLACLIEGRR